MLVAAIDGLRALFPGRLPASCFISHSYADGENLKALLDSLPARVSPLVFPPITVTPAERVSDDLVKAILGCTGLVYIDSEKTLSSVWCGFERDYARRAKKKVFGFNIRSPRFFADRSPPRPIHIFASYSKWNTNVVRSICDFMEERHFSVWSDLRGTPAIENFREAIRDGIQGTLRQGGYVLAFLSAKSVTSEWVQMELGLAAKTHPDRILPVLIEPVDMTQSRVQFQLAPAAVYEPGGDINWNRVDDLLVRIYDMVHRAEGAR